MIFLLSIQKRGAGYCRRQLCSRPGKYSAYVAYSNDSDGALADTPQVKAYDHKYRQLMEMTTDQGCPSRWPPLLAVEALLVLIRVNHISVFTLTPETVRFSDNS